MSVNAGKGQNIHHRAVQVLSKEITKDSAATVSLGWLPGYASVVGSFCHIKTAWSGTGNEEVDLGFRNSVEGLTADPDAYSETAFDLDAAAGFINGDVTQAANVLSTAPVEVTATITNTDSTTGRAFVGVYYVVHEV